MKPALAGLVAVWIFWGTNWPIWKVALNYTGPIEFMAVRSVVTALLMVVLVFALRKPIVPSPIGPIIVIGLLQGVGMNGLSVLAVADSSATTATIFAYTMPFWTVLFARWILHDEIKPRHLIAIGFGMIGIVIVAVGAGSRLTDIGALLAISGATCWALGTVLWKSTIARYDVDAFVMVTWQNIFSIVPLVAGAWLLHESPIQWAPFMIFAFVYNVVVTAVFAWFLWYWVVGKLPAMTAGFSSLAIPVISILTAYLFIGERPAPAQWAGIIAILIALAVVTLPAHLPRSDSVVPQETL